MYCLDVFSYHLVNRLILFLTFPLISTVVFSSGKIHMQSSYSNFVLYYLYEALQQCILFSEHLPKDDVL